MKKYAHYIIIKDSLQLLTMEKKSYDNEKLDIAGV